MCGYEKGKGTWEEPLEVEILVFPSEEEVAG